MGGPGARVSEQKHTCKNRASVHPLHFSLLDKRGADQYPPATSGGRTVSMVKLDEKTLR